MHAALLLFLLAAVPAAAELTADQRQADFRSLADSVARRYAHVDWKREGIKLDPLDTRPWQARLAQARNDIDFYEVMCEYVASFKDSHSAYLVPSTYLATLGFSLDLVDDKVTIDAINRNLQPAAAFAAEVGDELVSVDGRSAAEWMTLFQRFIGGGNPRTARREAAAWIATRQQVVFPRAHEVPAQGIVVVRKPDNSTSTYVIPWYRRGTPVTSVPGSPAIRTAAVSEPEVELPRSAHLDLMDTLRRLGPENWFGFGKAPLEALGIGSRIPVFDLPTDGYTARLGAGRIDLVTSGIFESGGLKIGYLRVGGFDSARITDQAIAEVRDLRDKTDGLIVDVMRNPGGLACAGEELASNLQTDVFNVHTVELRVGWIDYLLYRDRVDALREAGAPEPQIASFEFQLQAVEEAIRAGRTRTAPVPICGTTTTRPPATDRLTGLPLSYGKPLILLMDGYSGSAAETFASVLQDSGRALVVGEQSAGAGGTVASGETGSYADGALSLARGLVNRSKPANAPDLPSSPYVENVGIRPDVELGYMTRANLIGRGKPFLDRLLQIAADHIKSRQ